MTRRSRFEVQGVTRKKRAKLADERTRSHPQQENASSFMHRKPLVNPISIARISIYSDIIISGGVKKEKRAHQHGHRSSGEGAREFHRVSLFAC